MSILIKGMEMPNNCEKCKFSWVDSDHHRYCDANKPWGLDVTYFISDRHTDCPIIEIPDGHGRLIDADALIERMFDQLVAKTMMFGGQYVYTKEEINNAPTVIPSDKDGET